MPISTITSKGQITVPKKIRLLLGLKAGDRIVFLVREDGTVQVEPATIDLGTLQGALKPRRKGVSLEDMERAIRLGGTRK